VKYEVKDNVLGEDVFQNLCKIIMGKHFPWYYQSAIAYKHEDNKLEYYFTHYIFNNGSEGAFFPFFIPLFQALEVDRLIRVKANFYPSNINLVTHSPHIDYKMKHEAAIFSFNTCDGYTLLGSKHRVDSKANRLLTFRGDRKHASTNCTNARGRFNVNINYIKK